MVGNKPKGFTLVEMLAATAVIGLAVAAAAGIFAYASRAETHVRATARLADAAELLMARLTRLGRENSIDYTAYGGIIKNPVNALNLRDKNGKPVIINSALVFSSVDGVASLLPTDLKASDATFYIRPSDPTALQAPTVIIAITLFNPSIPDLAPYYLQTQVTLRAYE